MIQKIDLKDRIAILTEENICDLLNLYGELNIDRLSQIVNNHIRVAIDEIKEVEEKQLQVAYFLSRGNRSVEEKFTEFNICKVWLGWWKMDNAQSVAKETREKILSMYKVSNETTKNLTKKSGKKNSDDFKNRLLHLRRSNCGKLRHLLKEKGLDEKYYIVDKTAYGGSVTRLGRYAIYNNGQSPKEKSQYFGSFDEMKEAIEKFGEIKDKSNE